MIRNGDKDNCHGSACKESQVNQIRICMFVYNERDELVAVNYECTYLDIC